MISLDAAHHHNSLLAALAAVTNSRTPTTYQNSTVTSNIMHRSNSGDTATEEDTLQSCFANNIFDEDAALDDDIAPSPEDTTENGDSVHNSENANEVQSGVENLLNAQRRAFQKFTPQLPVTDLHNSRSPLELSNLNLTSFLVALQQQQPNSLQQQILNLAASTSGGSSGHGSPTQDGEEDLEQNGTAEPEDLSLGRDKKSDMDDCSASGNWSYEEQFKQLYEIKPDDMRRKEWLDDWLRFMHRIGKPVSRIPIMAKQVLDLYELYRLVVQHGGLVEIINKKLWREITKGLNLPSSITSAAFTLRTQYQKYLYDYECERENLSSLSDLQAAIEGNRREGRRNASASTPSAASGMNGSNAASAQFPFPLVPHSAAVAVANSFLGKHLNAFGLRPEDDHAGLSAAQQAFAAAYKAEQMAGMEAHQRQFEFFQRAAVETAARQSRKVPHADSASSLDSDSISTKRRRLDEPLNSTGLSQCASPGNVSPRVELSNVPSTHMKLSNARSPSGENTMVVSLEVNGLMYQGVLFAVNSTRSDSNKASSHDTKVESSELLNSSCDV